MLWYLSLLLVSLAGLALIDYRYKLAFFYAPMRAAKVLLLGVAFFLLWDVAGVGLGIFFVGETTFLTGIRILPEVPLEELFFLTLLCYLPLILYRFLERKA